MSLGIWQLVLLLVIVLLFFGAGKLPKVMGDIGKGVRSMRDGLKGDEEEKTPTARLEEMRQAEVKEEDRTGTHSS